MKLLDKILGGDNIWSLKREREALNSKRKHCGVSHIYILRVYLFLNLKIFWGIKAQILINLSYQRRKDITLNYLKPNEN